MISINLDSSQITSKRYQVSLAQEAAIGKLKPYVQSKFQSPNTKLNKSTFQGKLEFKQNYFNFKKYSLSQSPGEYLNLGNHAKDQYLSKFAYKKNYRAHSNSLDSSEGSKKNEELVKKPLKLYELNNEVPDIKKTVKNTVNLSKYIKRKGPARHLPIDDIKGHFKSPIITYDPSPIEEDLKLLQENNYEKLCKDFQIEKFNAIQKLNKKKDSILKDNDQSSWKWCTPGSSPAAIKTVRFEDMA
jgi:hypothetical protein